MSWAIAAIAVVLVLWAFAEAFVWPVVPDIALAGAAFLVPDGAVVFAAAAVVGSTIGGVTAMTAYRSGWRWPLPFVTERMTEVVAEWMEKGSLGLVHQPLTAVPYKVFVVEGAQRGLPRTSWAWWTAVFRGARMAAVAFGAVVASEAVARLALTNLTGARIAMLAVGLVVFFVGWRVAWVMWSKPSPSDRPGARARTMQS